MAEKENNFSWLCYGCWLEKNRKRCPDCGWHYKYSYHKGIWCVSAACKPCAIKKQEEEHTRKEEEKKKQHKQLKLERRWCTLSKLMLEAFDKHMMGEVHKLKLEQYKRKVAIEDEKLEELKRGIEWRVCSLCKGSCDSWIIKEDVVFNLSLLCKKCHKYKWCRCELCNGRFDLETFQRGDNYCTECFEEHIEPHIVSTSV